MIENFRNGAQRDNDKQPCLLWPQGADLTKVLIRLPVSLVQVAFIHSRRHSLIHVLSELVTGNIKINRCFPLKS